MTAKASYLNSVWRARKAMTMEQRVARTLLPVAHAYAFIDGTAMGELYAPEIDGLSQACAAFQRHLDACATCRHNLLDAKDAKRLRWLDSRLGVMERRISDAIFGDSDWTDIRAAIDRAQEQGL